jgi:Na+/citrate or Na+/malate symporter
MMAIEQALSGPDSPRKQILLRWWWAMMDRRLGIVPIPVFLLCLAVVGVMLRSHTLQADIPTNIAILAVGGFACAEIGKRTPLLRNLGFGAIVATFLPSYLAYSGALPAGLQDCISTFVASSNFLYLFISAIIVGSILGMDRRTLIGGFLKLFPQLAIGSVAAGAVGCAVGSAVGLGFQHTLFKIVVPIMAGGVGEGAIPLTMGYAAVTHQKQGDLFSEVLPAVMLASPTAIVFSGMLNYLGKLFPSLTGQGQLQPGEQDVHLSGAGAIRICPEPVLVGSAAVTIVSLFLLGQATHDLLRLPGPVVMLFVALLIKLGRLAPPSLEEGAYGVYQFFSTCVTYPLLFGIGVASIRWEKLMAAINLPTIVTIVATVATLMSTAFAMARLLRMHPIEAAIVNACHSGQGGTGDVAILTAADRMQLMPFAQIATRIGGAITVTLALLAFAYFHA